MNAPDSPCAGIGGTTDLTACLDHAAKAADADLNLTYRQILAVLGPADRARLVQAQRSWIAYRDQACIAQRELYAGGTARWPAYLACLEAQTRHRTEDLHAADGWRLEK